jgi:hypothetical protein
VASLSDLIDAYRRQFPDEAGELSDALAGDPQTSGWAVLCDGVERLLQLKDPVSRAWWLPHTALTAGVADPLAATAQALASQTGVRVDLADNSALPLHITIDDGGAVRMYYRFDVKEGDTVSPAAAERARWTPFDTVSNARLGEKLMSH